MQKLCIWMLVVGVIAAGKRMAVLDMEDLESNDSDIESRFRDSVNAATAKEDAPSEIYEDMNHEDIRRTKIISALNKLPKIELERLLNSTSPDVSSLDIATLDNLWARRQDELRAAMEATSASAQILAPFATAVRNFDRSDPDSIDDVQDQIDALENEIDDIDVARDFFDAFEGSRLLLPLLEEESSLTGSALQLLGTAVSNEAKLQDAALPLLPKVLALLNTKNVILQKKALYAIGSTIRQNPKALKAFGDHDGLHAVSSVLSQAAASLINDEKHRFAVVDKAATLLGDILSEETSALFLSNAPSSAMTEVCSAILSGISTVPADRRAERILRAATALTQQCNSIWLGTARKGLLSRLEVLAATIHTPDPDYQQEISQLITDLISTLRQEHSAPYSSPPLASSSSSVSPPHVNEKEDELPVLLLSSS